MWMPSDRARAESLAMRWGGTVSYTASVDGVRVVWMDPQGYTVTLSGAGAGEVIGMLSTILRETYAGPSIEAGHIY